MIVRVANRVLSAGSHARVNAFVTNASSILGTVVVEDAFGSAEFVGVSSVLWETSANAVVAFRVRATRRGVAGV